MSDPAPPRDTASPALAFIVVVLLLAGLYLAQDILIPIALATLVSFLLYPAAAWLTKRRVPHVISTIIVTGFSLLLVLGFMSLLVGQVYDLATKLPTYQENLNHKVQAFSFTSSKFAKVKSAYSAMGESMRSPTTASSQPSESAGPTTRPVDVRVVNDNKNPFAILTNLAGPAAGTLGIVSTAFVIAFFILLNAGETVDRVVWLGETRRFPLTRASLVEAGQRIGQYLRMQLIINATYGVMIGTALYFIGLPNALLFGVLTTALRYIPYVGPLIGALIPTLLSIAFFDDWRHPLIVAISFAVCEGVTNGLLEPWLYGQSIGVSALGVVVATFVWAFLWGGWGMVLAVPITASLVVLGKGVPGLHALTVLLSNEPVPTSNPPPKSVLSTSQDGST